jgi:hypothetical protein
MNRILGSREPDTAQRAQVSTAKGPRPQTVALLAALLGAVGAIALILSPSSVAILLLILVLLPIVCWTIALREFRTALLFTTIGELYSISNGTWTGFGPLSLRWMLVLGTPLVYAAIGILVWNPQRLSQYRSKPGHAAAMVSFGALIPLFLFGYAVAFTNNAAGAAAQSFGFLLVLLLYFPLYHSMRIYAQQTAALVLGLSLPLAVTMLLMSVGPMAYRRTIMQNVVGDNPVGITVTGISRVMPTHIVLMLLPVFLSIFEMTRAGSFLRKTALGAIALFFLLPMVVTFLAGPLLSLFAVIFVSGAILVTRPASRSNGRAILLTATGLAVAVLGAAMIFTPDLLDLKLLSRISSLASGDFGIDARRDYQRQVAAEDYRSHFWLGRGAGALMPSVEGGPEPRVEMEELMIFHRYGVLGSMTLLAGFVAFAVQPFYALRRRRTFDGKAAMALALWASACAIVVCGMVNPFLTTPFPALLIGMYLAWEERLPGGSGTPWAARAGVCRTQDLLISRPGE